MKKLALRRSDKCAAVCGLQLPTGVEAWWDSQGRKVFCVSCYEITLGADSPLEAAENANSSLSEASPMIDTGHAGKSALDEYQRRHDRREARIEAKYGRFTGVVKILTDDPQSTLAWRRGSIGEQKLAKAFAENLGERAILLNDRKVPKSHANIDHIAISPSGLWVIDAKNYSGLVEQRDVGGFSTSDIRLFVDGRVRTKLAEALEWQVKFVRASLDDNDIDVCGALCFTDAQWGWLAKPFSVRGVCVSGPNALSRRISEVDALSEERIWSVAERLSKQLPSK